MDLKEGTISDLVGSFFVNLKTLNVDGKAVVGLIDAYPDQSCGDVGIKIVTSDGKKELITNFSRITWT